MGEEEVLNEWQDRKEKIFKEWEERIKSYPKLNIEQARKKKNPEEALEGTMYVVLNYIKTSMYSKFKSNIYDLNDIINSAMYVWAEEIKSGKLNKVDNFSNIYHNAAFNNKISEILLSSKGYESISDTFYISADLFLKELNIYLNILRNNPKIISDKEIFIEEIKEAGLYSEHVPTNYYENLIELFNCIIDSFDCDLDELNITKSNLRALQHVLIRNGYENYFNDRGDFYNESFMKGFEKKILNDEIRDFIWNSPLLTDREKEVLKYRYGMFEETPHTLEETGKHYGITRERIRQIEAKALRKLNFNSKFRSFLELPNQETRDIPEAEYQNIINTYGREVKRVVDRYYEKHYRYPEFYQIQEELVNNDTILPGDVAITRDGDVVIPYILMSGITPRYDISFSTIESKEVIKDVYTSTPQYSVRVDRFQRQQREAKELRKIKKYRSATWDEEDKDSLFEQVKANPQYFRHLSKEKQNDYKLINDILDYDYKILYDAEDLSYLDDRTLSTIFSGQIFDRIVSKYGYNIDIINSYKKHMLDNDKIGRREFMRRVSEFYIHNNLISKITDLDDDILLDDVFMLNILPYASEYYLSRKEDVFEHYNDSPDIVRAFVCLDNKCFEDASERLRNDIDFIKELLHSARTFADYITDHHEGSLLLSIISATYGGDRGFASAFYDISKMSSDTLQNLYPLLYKYYDYDYDAAARFFVRVAETNDKLLEICPRALQNKRLVEMFEARHPGKHDYVNALLKKHNITYDTELKQQPPVIEEKEPRDITNLPYNEITLMDLKKYTGLSVLKDLYQKGFINLEQILALDNITLDSMFHYCERLNEIKRFVALMQCKYYGIYQISPEELFATTDIKRFYNLILLSDNLKNALLQQAPDIITPERFFREVEILKQGRSHLDLNRLQLEELLAKGEIFKDYVTNSRKNG